MKIVKINESQKDRLLEARSEEFSLRKLSSMKDTMEMVRYCFRTLGDPFSEGSSRMAFMLTDNLVLKLAYRRDGAGTAQNEAEYNVYRKYRDMGVTEYVTRILMCDKEYRWLVSENAVPCEMIDFEKVFGIPYFNEYTQRTNDTDYGIGYDKYFDNLRGRYEHSDISFYEILEYIHSEVIGDGEMYNPKVERFIRNNRWLSGFRDFAIEADVNDFCSYQNFGLVKRNGKDHIVLLDSGMNYDVWCNNYA